MADLCETINADITALSEGIGLDKRIGSAFLKAGPGFGGSCFPKDILALKHVAKKANCECLILDAVIAANTNRPYNIINKIASIVGGSLIGKNLAILGLTYKAGTDDIRSSPAIELINLLKKSKVNIKAYDPKGMPNVSKYFKDLECTDTVISAATMADAIIIVTEWPEFKELDFKQIKSVLRDPIIIDLRNIIDTNKLKGLGYKYYSIGKKNES